MRNDRPNVYISPKASSVLREILGEVFPDANIVNKEEMGELASIASSWPAVVVGDKIVAAILTSAFYTKMESVGPPVLVDTYRQVFDLLRAQKVAMVGKGSEEDQ